MSRRGVLLIVAMFFAAVSVEAATPAGQHQYIVKLKYLFAQPNASAPAPIGNVVAGLGGQVERQWPDRMVITLPDAAIEALRQHAAVKYFQRVVTGPFVAHTSQSGSKTVESSLARAADSTPPTWSSGAYAYDSAGNITAIGTDTYSYDHLLRLNQAHVSGNAETYTYDAFGNLISKTTTPAVGSPLTVDRATDLATNRISAESYDAAGNDTGVAPESNTYDPVSMMVKSVNVYNVPTYYAYTADDERIAVLPCPGGSSCTDQFWTISIRDLNGKVIRQYESPYFAPGLGSYPSAWKEDYVYRDGVLLGAERPAEEGGERHLHVDHLGTPRLITGVGGQRISEHDYYPFGVEITSMRQEVAGGFDREDPIKFTGHERDFLIGTESENANYNDYMHARYTVPQWGRFLSPDPTLGNLLRPGSWNRYAYVMNNPVRYADPSGLETITVTARDPIHDSDETFEADFFFESRLLTAGFHAHNAVAGFSNAFSSNMLLGAGRVDLDDDDYELGQLGGDVASALAGGEEMIGGMAGDIVGGLLDATGAGAVVGIPVNVVATAVAAHGGAVTAVSSWHAMSDIRGRSGGGRTGRKINPKREEVLRAKLADAIERRSRARTNAERQAIQKEIDHLRLKLTKSETHWR